MSRVRGREKAISIRPSPNHVLMKINKFHSLQDPTWAFKRYIALFSSANSSRSFCTFFFCVCSFLQYWYWILITNEERKFIVRSSPRAIVGQIKSAEMYDVGAIWSVRHKIYCDLRVLICCGFLQLIAFSNKPQQATLLILLLCLMQD